MFSEGLLQIIFFYVKKIIHENDKVVNFHPASLKHLELLSFPYPLLYPTIFFLSLKPTSHYSLFILHCRNRRAGASAENKIQ